MKWTPLREDSCSAIAEKSGLTEPSQIFQCRKRLFYGNPSQGEFPMAAEDLASIEASCQFFRQSTNLSLTLIYPYLN